MNTLEKGQGQVECAGSEWNQQDSNVQNKGDYTEGSVHDLSVS